MENLLNRGTNNNTTGVNVNLMSEFEAFVNGGVTKKTVITAGTYTGTVKSFTKVEGKDYHKIIVETDTHTVPYVIFDLTNFLFEYNLIHSTVFTTMEQIIGQPCTIYVYECKDKLRYSQLPVLPEGTHTCNFQGLYTIDINFIIKYEYAGTMYYDVKVFNPEPRAKDILMDQFRTLAEGLGFPAIEENLPFNLYAEKIGTDFIVNCVLNEKYNNRFTNYKLTKEETTEATPTVSLSSFR